jgi:hypothetical protein
MFGNGCGEKGISQRIVAGKFENNAILGEKLIF